MKQHAWHALSCLKSSYKQLGPLPAEPCRKGRGKFISVIHALTTPPCCRPRQKRGQDDWETNASYAQMQWTASRPVAVLGTGRGRAQPSVLLQPPPVSWPPVIFLPNNTNIWCLCVSKLYKIGQICGIHWTSKKQTCSSFRGALPPSWPSS